MLAKKITNPTDKHVGAKVRARRLMLGLSQMKLADGLGLTFQQVQKYEKGSNRIGASRLQQIAQLLKVEPSWFFEGGPRANTMGAAGVLTPEQSATNATTKAFDDFLTTPYAIDLMQDYAKLTNQQRDVVVRVARALAEGRPS